MISRITVALFLLALGQCRQVIAYDTETHAAMTQEAYLRSVLHTSAPGSVVDILGLTRLIDTETPYTPFWAYWTQYPARYYNDGSGTSSAPHGENISYPQAFERCQMQEFVDGSDGRYPSVPAEVGNIFDNTVALGSDGMIAGDTVLPLQNWLVRGAIREDDLGASTIIGAANGIYCEKEFNQSDQGVQIRSLNHFYDPWTDAPLIALGTSKGLPGVDWALGYSNTFTNNPPVVASFWLNKYTYNVARNMLYWALTRELSRQNNPTAPYTNADRMANAVDRMTAWATTFRSLGDAVHLLQDMAQPQHTRNDPHTGKFSSSSQIVMEDYIDDRVLGRKGGAGSSQYLLAFFNNSQHELDNQMLPVDLGNYPRAMFASPIRFFSTRGGKSDTGNPPNRSGLADFTNRSFFTAGTKLAQNPPVAELYPPQSVTPDVYSVAAAPCVQLTQTMFANVNCTHVAYSGMTDTVAPTYHNLVPPGFTAETPPVISYGAFNSIILDLQRNGVLSPAQTAAYGDKFYAISPTEYDTIADMNIPRGVGYSHGLIDYFFRGVGGIQVTPPDSGVYAILDHGVQHTMNQFGYPCTGTDTSDGCNVFGFTQLQAKIKNVMDPVTETATFHKSVPQHMTSGTLVAVARYHRDKCYTPDLAGDPSIDMNNYQSATQQSDIHVIYSSICSGSAAVAAGRTQVPEISVSSKIAVDASGHFTVPGMATVDLNGGSSSLVQFDFYDDPIPVNATDLFLQVVFFGTVGDTSNDDSNDYEINSLAMGSVDVSEPTYNTFMNLDNYFYDPISQTWMTTGEAQEQHFAVADPAQRYIPTIYECLGNSKLVRYTLGDASSGLPAGHAIRVAEILDLNWRESGTR